MGAGKYTLIAFAGVAIASLTVAWRVRQKGNIEWQSKEGLIRSQEQALVVATAENERLSNVTVHLRDSQALTQPDFRELLRLRGHIGELRHAGAEQQKLQASNATLRTAAQQAEQRLAEAKAAPNYWPREQLVFSGYTDPESALKTVLSAMVKHDVTSWASACTPQAKAGLEREWKKHGKTEAEALEEMKHMCDAMTAGAAGFRVVESQEISPEQVIMSVSFDGADKIRRFVLKKIGAEWKFHNVLVAGQNPGRP